MPPPRTRPSGLNATEMRNDIQGASRTLPTAVFALHLKTPEGRRDHARAAAQYGELTRMDTGQSLYYPVELGDRMAYRYAIATLSNAIVNEIQKVRGGGGDFPGETFVSIPALLTDQDVANTRGTQGVDRRDRARDGARLSRERGRDAGP